MNKPTEEQIKEFWEWCGLKYTCPYWVDENGDCALYGEYYSELLSSINLNNLFKYALPELLFFIVEFNCTSTDGNCVVTLEDFYLAQPVKKYQAENKNPALALFWAIYKLIKDGD